MPISKESTPQPQQHFDLDTVDESRLSEEAQKTWRKESRRIVILAVTVTAFMAIAHWTPLRAWITNVQLWKGYIRDMGWLASVGFTTICALAVFVGVPRLSLSAAAGMLFGFAQGMLLSLVGSAIGSYGAFLMARLGGRKTVLRRAESWPWLTPLLHGLTISRVFWIRQLMLPGVVLNVLLGISAVRQTTFLIGTLAGYLPLTAVFSLVGSGLGKESLAKSMVQVMTGVGLLNLGGWIVWRRFKNRHPEAERLQKL